MNVISERGQKIYLAVITSIRPNLRFSIFKLINNMVFLIRLDEGNVDRTIEILGKLSTILENWILEGSIKAETLYGVELLNEPRGWEEPIWAKCRDYFYPNGYKKIRSLFSGIEESKRPWVTMQSAFRYL